MSAFLSSNGLSVVVPMHNEAENAAPLIAEIVAAVTALAAPFEIICVEDGSTDATLAVLLALKATVAELRVIRHRQAVGQSTSVRTGVIAARYAWVATLDGDGQNDPADIPALEAAVTPTVELVIGNRRGRRQDSWIKRISSIIANSVRSRLLGDATPDTGCGIKLFPRQVFLDLPYFDHMHRFLPALVRRHGGEVVSVAVNHRPRRAGQSNYGTLDRLKSGVIDLIGVMWLMRQARRPVSEEM